MTANTQHRYAGCDMLGCLHLVGEYANVVAYFGFVQRLYMFVVGFTVRWSVFKETQLNTLQADPLCKRVGTFAIKQK